MCEKIKAFWDDLDVNIAVNRRELILELALCTLTGLVAGMLCSPRKNITIGSNNYMDNPDASGCEDGEDEEDVVKF